MVQKLTKFFSNNWVIVASLIVIAAPAALKLLMPGFYEPHDLHHFADIYQMFRAIGSGQIPPRWGPDYLYNFGYPLFNFYYVMPFYLGALFLSLFGSIQLAFKLVFISCIGLGVWGMYLMLREFTGKFESFVGTIVFLYTPYRAVQIYVRGAIGEALSLALTPLVAFVFIQLVKSPRLRNIGVAALVFGIFILSHNYMWALSLPWIITLALLFVEKKTWRKSFWYLVMAGIMGLAVSAYWWIPAIVEQKLVAATTPFPLINHFPFISQLIIPSWGYGPSNPFSSDHLSYQIGLINLLGVLISFILIVFFRKIYKNKKYLRITLWGLISFLIVFFMMNIRSYAIWRILPFHDFVQFPWRLLSFTAFFSAILIAVSLQILQKNIKIYLGLALMFGSIILTLNYFQPSHVVFKSDAEYLQRFFAYNGKVSQDYKNYSEDYLLLPKTTDKKPDYLPANKILSISGTVSDIKENSPINWTASVVSAKDTTATFYTLNFPGWKAEMDGKQVQIISEKPYGQIEINVPKGIHSVSFVWEKTGLRLTSDIISLVGILASIFFVFKGRRVKLVR